MSYKCSRTYGSKFALDTLLKSKNYKVLFVRNRCVLFKRAGRFKAPSSLPSIKPGLTLQQIISAHNTE